MNEIEVIKTELYKLWGYRIKEYKFDMAYRQVSFTLAAENNGSSFESLIELKGISMFCFCDEDAASSDRVPKYLEFSTIDIHENDVKVHFNLLEEGAEVKCSCNFVAEILSAFLTVQAKYIVIDGKEYSLEDKGTVNV